MQASRLLSRLLIANETFANQTLANVPFALLLKKEQLTLTPEPGNPTPKKPQTTFRRIGQPALIIASILYGLFFIPWIVLAGMLLLSYSPSDALFTYLATCTYPLLAIGGLAAGFVLYRQNRFQAAFFILFLPLIGICLMVASFVPIWP